MKKLHIPAVDRYISRQGLPITPDYQMAVVGYILRLFDSSAFTKMTADLPSNVRKEFRMGIRTKSNLILDFKLAAINSLKTRTNCFLQEGLASANINFVPLLKQYDLYDKYLLLIKDVPILTGNQARQQCGEVIKKLNSYIAKFVSHSMSFICKGNNLDRKDLEGLIKYDTIQSYYNEVPFVRDLHLFNKCKSKIQSSGNNLIKFYTTQKRKRMVEANGKYEGTVVSIEQSNDGEFNVLDRLEVAQPNQYAKIDGAHTIYSIFKRYERPNSVDKGAKYKALWLLSCLDDPKFVQWYNAHYPTRKKYVPINTQDVYEDIGDSEKYNEVVRQYLKAGRGSWNSFLVEVQQYF